MTANVKTWKTWNVKVRVVANGGTQDVTVQASGTNSHDARANAERQVRRDHVSARAVVAISSRRAAA